MGGLNFMLVCVCVGTLSALFVDGQDGSRVKIPRTRFTCQGRASGYYADIDTGCQVYHMCDGLGRQFSYSCPNTTLFQQRMLICDHWYMVNCSMSERDYDANLLIGQRDKPFVSDDEMRLRTPRPDILSVPPNNNYYDGLKEAESNYQIHPGNSIVGIADSLSGVDNDLDSGKQNYRPPTSWSTGIGQHPQRKPSSNFGKSFNTNIGVTNEDNLAGAASQRPPPTFRPTAPAESQNSVTITPPTKELVPPLSPVSTTENSNDYDLDIRAKSDTKDPVYDFIKRFDPNSPDSIKTSMSRSEIINLNKHLPEGQVSSEEERTPRKSKNFEGKGNSFNSVQRDNKKRVSEGSRFDTVNLKPINPIQDTVSSTVASIVPVPDRHLLPPKADFSPLDTTTMGPPIYYEWKWAVPAFDLEPPKVSNVTNKTDTPKVNAVGKRPFSVVTRSTPKMPTPSPSNTEYNISSYFVPDYVFPLDVPHPGYEDADAHTSFQVKVSRPGRASFGENPACPQCHPAYLKPGTCEPCIVR